MYSSPGMSQFREHFLSKLIALLTLALFLNISFSALEINLLGLKNDAGLQGVISLVLSGTFLEEEREMADDFSHAPSESNETEFFFKHPIYTGNNHRFILSDLTRSIFDHPLPIGRDCETLVPPPQQVS